MNANKLPLISDSRLDYIVGYADGLKAAPDAYKRATSEDYMRGFGDGYRRSMLDFSDLYNEIKADRKSGNEQ